MFTRIALLSLCACLLTSSQGGCQSPFYTKRGATVGGLTGAGLGAIIGEAAADKPLAGAAIGTAVGALTGAMTGSALDDIENRNQARVQYQSQQAYARASTIDDVIAMTRAGLSDEVITQHLRTNGFVGTLRAPELIMLKQQGVSDRVVYAMQGLQSGPYVGAVPQSVVAAPPVIVEEHYYVRPPPPVRVYPYYWPHPSRHYYHHRPAPGVRWGVTIGN